MRILNDEKIIHSMSGDIPPLLCVKEGESIKVKTRSPGIPDEVFEKDYSVEPYPKRILSITGPLFVEGASPGDILKIHIEKIELDNSGKMWMGQWMGILMDEVNEPYLKKVKIENGQVIYDDNISFPIDPMIGTIGVAPRSGDIECLYPGEHGGNMDVLEVREGSIVYLPVFVEGGLLSVGDVHAAMGDGEIFGTGVEIGSYITLKVEIIKGEKIQTPLIETKDAFVFIVSEGTFEESCKELTRRMVNFYRDQLKVDFNDAYALVGQTAHLGVAQVVNPIPTIKMTVTKKMLNKLLGKEV